MDIDYTRYGYIYRITNMVNNKTYIGQHKIKPKEKFLDYMGSGRLIVRAVKKYGKNNFIKEIIEYSDSKDELNILEKKYISEELSKDRCEYNIDYSDSSLRTSLVKNDITDEQLISWYLDCNMSFLDISVKLNCSYPTIYSYMQNLKHLDKRFDLIKHGDNRGKTSGFTPESFAKAMKTSGKKVECKNCGTKISHNNFSKHYNVCVDENFTYVDGVKKKKCPVDNCDTLIYTKNKTCKEHVVKTDYNSIKTPESLKLAGISSSHKRWHVKRSIINPDCPLCNPVDEIIDES